MAVNGLAQLGVALGAVVAWPEIDCNTEWVSCWARSECRVARLADSRVLFAAVPCTVLR